MNKIKEEELAELNDAQMKLNDAVLKLGELEVHKHKLLHLIPEREKELSKIQAILGEAYGNVDINRTTGEYFERIGDATT